jgi:hypothetical protein
MLLDMPSQGHSIYNHELGLRARTRPSPSFHPIDVSSLYPAECLLTPWYRTCGSVEAAMVFTRVTP